MYVADLKAYMKQPPPLALWPKSQKGPLEPQPPAGPPLVPPGPPLICHQTRQNGPRPVGCWSLGWSGLERALERRGGEQEPRKNFTALRVSLDATVKLHCKSYWQHETETRLKGNKSVASGRIDTENYLSNL